MTKFVLKYRYLIIIFSLVLALGGLSLMPRMETDPDIKNYFPASMESRINTDIIEYEFGTQELIMIVYEDSCILTAENLSSIKKTVRQLDRLGSIDKTISLFNTRRIFGEDGMMIVDPAIKRMPRSESDINILKSQLNDNPLAMGTVVSEDFTMAIIAVTISVDGVEGEILAAIESIVDENKGPATVHYGGFPYIRQYIMSDVRRDGFILVPLALVIMLGFLWFAFREWKGMVLPFTVVVLSIAVSMGLAPLMGWKLSVISLLVPIMLIAVANDYGIHMIAKYQELNTLGYKGNNDGLVATMLNKLRMPIIFTGLTTIAGMLGLLTHAIIPARHVGILVSVGVAFAVLLTLLMLPAWLSVLKRSRPGIVALTSKKSLLDRSMVFFAAKVTANPRKVLFISAILTLVFALGIMGIKVDGNQENLFPEKHPVKQSSSIINKHFGGSQSISVMIEGDIKDPGLLNIMDTWSAEIKEMTGVGDSYSISTVIKEMTKALYEVDEKGYNSIPETRDAVAQVLEIYNMSGDPEDFDRLVDFDYSKAHLMIRFEEPETKNIRNVLNRLDQLSIRDNIDIIKGGYAYIMFQFADKIVSGQISSLTFAICIVLILLSIIFRSLKGGLISTIPILASVVFLMGFMGISGISLNSATALLSSIMIGVGVDYTIHYLWRYKSELISSDHKTATEKTLTTTGRGIVYNAFSVMIGFSVLVFSGFASIRFFGYLVLISIGVCLISALFVIPALMLVFKPKFIEPAADIKITNKKSKRIMKKAVILTLMLLVTISLQAQDNASDIMDKSRHTMKVGSFEAIASLTITDSKGRIRERKNITASKSFDDGTEKRLIKFLSPAEVKGTSILIYDYDEGQDDMWIYLPALKRTRRIVSSDKGKSFMGSEFSNSDMSSPPVGDFNHNILSDSEKEWLIESKPVDMDKEDEYGYSRKLSYISKKDMLVRKMEFYNFDNELYKTIEIKDFIKVSDNRYIIKHMVAINIIKNRSSEIILSEIHTGTQIRDELFTLANLER